MKTLSKKLLSLMLVAIMLVSVMPFAAFADSTDSDGYKLILDVDGKAVYAKADRPAIPAETVELITGTKDGGNETVESTLILKALGLDSKYEGYTCTEVVKNTESKLIRLELTSPVKPTDPSEPTTAPTEPQKITYTVNLWVDGSKQVKTLTYDEGHVADLSTAEKVLKELGMDASKYNIGGTFTNQNYVIEFSITTKSTAPTEPDAKTVEITLDDGTKTTKQYPEVGKYYSDYAVFYPSAQDGRTPESLKIEENNGSVRIVDVGTKTENGKVRATDVKVSIQWKAADRKINFYTDSTLAKVYKSLVVYSGKAIGELPTEVNGKAVEYWTVWGTRIYSTTTYNWTADAVNAVPHFAGESGKVYLEIYVNGNRTSKYAQRDITHKLQDGVIYRDTLLDVIRDGVKNSSLKLSSVSYLFDESEWSAYVRDSKKTTTNTKVQIGDSEDARYIYVMVNGVTTKTTDSTNPKTGDTAKLGVAAAVLAVAVVGFGAVIVVNKKKGIQ